jgi:hypothetical protein
MKKYILTAALVAGFAMPAMAASEYYVAQSAKDKKCEVTSKKPDGKKLIEIGTSTYKTKADATKAMKAAPECAPAKK